jgi:transcriptional regulator with XRE-family HTH domain
MAHKIQPVQSSKQLEKGMCGRLEQLRLARNITQSQLADAAGISLRTVTRMAKGEGISLDTFIRILIALGIQENLAGLVPDPGIRPVERVRGVKRERLRARPSGRPPIKEPWTWGNDD